MNFKTICFLHMQMAVAGAAQAVSMDRRSLPNTRTNRFKFRHNTWKLILLDTRANLGWFQREFRMSRTAFEAIALRIGERWRTIYP
jgi:hypothetical protein